MSHYRKDLGALGEQLGVTYLQEHGFLVIDRNFTTHWGELDLIAKKDKCVYFVEVKTKIGDKKGKPYEAVTYRKLQNLKRSINMYLLKNDYKTYKLSICVLSIELNPDKSVKEMKFFENVEL